MKLLAEHALPFSEEAVAEIGRISDERRVSLAKKRQFVERGAAAEDRNGNGAAHVGDVVIRFREALDYERSVALFQRIQQVLARHAGPAPVYLELPRAGSGIRRVATTFRTRPSDELAGEIEGEVGPGVVDVVLPEVPV